MCDKSVRISIESNPLWHNSIEDVLPAREKQNCFVVIVK